MCLGGMSRSTHGLAMLSRSPCALKHRSTSKRVCWIAQESPLSRLKSRKHRVPSPKRSTMTSTTWMPTATSSTVWMSLMSLEKTEPSFPDSLSMNPPQQAGGIQPSLHSTGPLPVQEYFQQANQHAREDTIAEDCQQYCHGYIDRRG